MEFTGSFSQILPQLKQGDNDAVQVVWERYFEPLQKLAKTRINQKDRKVRDEEDLALSAINAFQICVQNGRYERIDGRDDVWNLLVTIVERKAIDHVRNQRAKKRGAGYVHGTANPASLNRLSEKQVSHEEKVDFLEHLEATLAQLRDPELVTVIYSKIEGCTNAEVASRIGKSVSSVERKLRLAREILREADRP